MRDTLCMQPFCRLVNFSFGRYANGAPPDLYLSVGAFSVIMRAICRNLRRDICFLKYIIYLEWK